MMIFSQRATLILHETTRIRDETTPCSWITTAQTVRTAQHYDTTSTHTHHAQHRHEHITHTFMHTYTRTHTHKQHTHIHTHLGRQEVWEDI